MDEYSEVALLDDVANLPSIIEEVLCISSNICESFGLYYLAGWAVCKVATSLNSVLFALK